MADNEAVGVLSESLKRRDPNDCRVEQQPSQAKELAKLCGYLPLALHIVGALLADDPARPLANMATELADAQDRLGDLAYGERGVLAAFERSWNHLLRRDAGAARLFRLLPANTGPEVSTEIAAALSNESVETVRRHLRTLLRAHLTEHGSATDRWRMHDLVRLYAAKLDEARYANDGRSEATERLLRYYNNTAKAAQESLRGQGTSTPFSSVDEALNWLDVEHANLTAAFELARATKNNSLARTLSRILDQVFSLDRLAFAVYRQWEAETSKRRLYDPYPIPTRCRLLTGDNGDEGPALGIAGDALDLHNALAAAPSGRLVVLGEPGSGKSTVLIRLVLKLLARRAAGEPVPILLHMAAWDPSREGLREWIARRLVEDYPGLDHAISLVRIVHDPRLLLPVLDGLDEMSSHSRNLAVERLNHELGSGEGVVISCRLSEYHQALNAGSRPAINAATCIVLEPPDASAIGDFLRLTAPGHGAARRWDPVIAALHSNTPVARALSTPLMIDLTQRMYNTPGGDPAELCDNARFPDQAAIELHLIDSFVAAHLSTPGRREHAWTTEQAASWLGFLAGHLYRNLHGSVDIAWWQIHKATPRPISWFLALANPAPSQVLGGLTLRPRRLLGFAILGGLLGGVIGALLDGGSGSLWSAIILALAGLFEGVQPSFSNMLSNATPLGTLRTDCWVFITRGLVFALMVGLAVGPFVDPLGALAISAVVGVIQGFRKSAWGGFVLARSILATQGKLPWRLLAFLDDAHRRGILRQVGAVYQFYHFAIQESTASSPCQVRP